jgi:hypothetical protein
MDVSKNSRQVMIRITAVLMTFTVVVSGWYCPILSGTIRAIILGQYKQHKL